MDRCAGMCRERETCVYVHVYKCSHVLTDSNIYVWKSLRSHGVPMILDCWCQQLMFIFDIFMYIYIHTRVFVYISVPPIRTNEFFKTQSAAHFATRIATRTATHITAINYSLVYVLQ